MNSPMSVVGKVIMLDELTANAIQPRRFAARIAPHAPDAVGSNRRLAGV
jgi:hypothetical protein